MLAGAIPVYRLGVWSIIGGVLEDRSARRLYERIVREASRILASMPAEHKSIAELLEEDEPSIRLADGTRHRIDESELQSMAERIPWYMRGLVKLPIIIIYERGEKPRYTVDGDVWAARAVSALLGGDPLVEKRELTLEEVEELIRRYKTLVFVTIRIEHRLLDELEELLGY